MKLSFSTVGCPDWRWGEIISAASDLGYNGVEIRGVGRELEAPDVSQFAAASIEQTKKQLETLNLQIPVLASSVLMARDDEDVIALGKKYVDTASALGTKYVRVLGDENPRPSKVDIPTVARNASQLAEYASDKNVTLLVETNGAFADSEQMMRLLNYIKRDNVKVLWDVHHPFRFMGEPIRLTYKKLSRYIVHTHIKDSANVDGNIKYARLGAGTVPVAECVKLLNSDGYDGFYSLEWVRRWDKSLEEPGLVFAHYVSYMRNL